MDYALFMLGRKSYARSELKKRLEMRARKKKLEEAPAAIEKVLERLKELGYLDDEKLLKNYLEYTLPTKPQGKQAFVSTMMRRGIKSSQAIAAWSRAAIDEAPLLNEVLQKAIAKYEKEPHQKRKAKIAGLLMRRGFSPGLVWDALAKI